MHGTVRWKRRFRRRTRRNGMNERCSDAMRCNTMRYKWNAIIDLLTYITSPEPKSDSLGILHSDQMWRDVMGCDTNEMLVSCYSITMPGLDPWSWYLRRVWVVDLIHVGRRCSSLNRLHALLNSMIQHVTHSLIPGTPYSEKRSQPRWINHRFKGIFPSRAFAFFSIGYSIPLSCQKSTQSNRIQVSPVRVKSNQIPIPSL